MIDHIAFEVENYEESKAFYQEVLKSIGCELVMEGEFSEGLCAGFGLKNKPSFWIYKGKKTTPQLHIAFHAESRKQVDAFYKAAIKAGAIDNGPPGIREHYHPNYYGAFVLDPEGHNIEAVCHKPE